MYRTLALLCFCVLGGLGQAYGQPLKGMVWTPPPTFQEAEADLRQMHAIGVQAIRTGLIEDEALLTLADTLGLALFQELPIRHRPAQALLDSLETAQQMLTAALQRASRHASARHFGLTTHSDTSDPRACVYFETLAQEAGRLPNVQVYYIPLFVNTDQCSGQVDFVLLDVTEAESPYTPLIDWQTVHPGRPAGVGAIGTWTLGDRIVGTQRPRSLEAQARYLENELPPLLADTSQVLAVFVDRWQDTVQDTPVTYQRRVHVDTYRTGLHDAAGTPRPALEVVSGIYRNEQTVFAFPTGTSPLPSASWMILLGWAIVGVLVAGYAGLPRFQRMTLRYFSSHGFFRDAIRDARESVLDINILLLVLQALAAGLTGVFLIDALRIQPAFAILLGWTPEAVQGAAATLVVHPWVALLLVAGFYALNIALWSILLGVLSRQRYGGLVLPQVLTLVVWARWPFFLVMITALVASTWPSATWGWWGVILLVAWLLITALSILRTLADYQTITRLPWALTVLLILGYPALWLGIATTLLALSTRQEMTFIWHLLTRS